MEQRVREIISKDFEEIKSTSLSLELLEIYSILYLYGGQPKTCEKSQRKYYEQLKKNGIMKAKEDHKKTCKVNWKGNRYISKQARHFNNEYITDAQAIDLLKKGHLSESDFIKLPEDYGKPAEPTLKELKKIADDLSIKYDSKIKKAELNEKIESFKINKLQDERALEIIEFGIEDAPEDLGNMTDENWLIYLTKIKEDYENKAE